MESATDLELHHTLHATFGQCSHGFLHSGYGAGDDDLARAVVVGRHDDLVGDGATDLLDDGVFSAKNSRHSGLLQFAGFLHRVSTNADQTQTVLETERSGYYEGGIFAQGVACNAIRRRLAVLHRHQTTDDRMEEDGGLCDFGLTQVLVGAGEHQVRDTEAEDVVGFLEEVVSKRAGLIQVPAHAHKLRSLTGKNVCFHYLTMMAATRAKIA